MLFVMTVSKGVSSPLLTVFVLITPGSFNSNVAQMVPSGGEGKTAVN